MSTKKLGVAILGCGKAGRYHTYWYSKNPHCKLIGFYNRTPSKAKELASRHGAKVYEKWEELVAESSVDVVSLCSPAFQHTEQAIFAFNNKKHVLCEKPMASNLEECGKMIEASKRSGKLLGLFFNMRFNPVILAVNDNIERIGRIFSVDMSFPFNRKVLGWRGESDSKTGVLMENGTHAVDLAITWLGDVERVSAEVARYKENSACDDHVFAICRFKNGAIGKFYASYNDPSFYDEQVEGLFGQIVGESGKICFLLNSYDQNRNRAFMILDGEEQELKINQPLENDEIYPGHMDSFKRLIDGFVDCVIDNRQFSPSGEDGMKTIKFVEDAFESSGWGRQ